MYIFLIKPDSRCSFSPGLQNESLLHFSKRFAKTIVFEDLFMKDYFCSSFKYNREQKVFKGNETVYFVSH